MISLFPSDKNNLLVSRKSKLDALNLMYNLIGESIEACFDFLNKKYMTFDAQVGETSCQIRAWKICLLAHNQNFIDEIQCLVSKLIKYKNSILVYTGVFENSTHINSKYLKELDQKENIVDFFKKIDNNLITNDDCLFIISAHFLNKYCIFCNNFPNAIDYNLIKQSLMIGSTTARNLANHYQLILSKLSCNFVLQQSTYVSELPCNNYYNFLQNLLKIGDGKRYTLPYYYVTKILFSNVVTTGLPIVFSVCDNYLEPLILFFKKDGITNQMRLQPITDNVDIYAPSIVFQGSVFESDTLPLEEYKNNILQIGVEEIILLNAASHPQYTGEILRDYSIEPCKDIVATNSEQEKILISNIEELTSMRIKSESIGCSKNNYNRFYIKHIFCSTFFAEQNALFYKDKSWLKQNYETAQNKIQVGA